MPKRPFRKVCNAYCYERFCSIRAGPKVEVPGTYTDAQTAKLDEANGLLQKAALIERREKVKPYIDRARELRVPSALNVYAGLNGQCCRRHLIYDINPNGQPWCTEKPFCKKSSSGSSRPLWMTV